MVALKINLAFNATALQYILEKFMFKWKTNVTGKPGVRFLIFEPSDLNNFKMTKAQKVNSAIVVVF